MEYVQNIYLPQKTLKLSFISTTNQVTWLCSIFSVQLIQQQAAVFIEEALTSGGYDSEG